MEFLKGEITVINSRLNLLIFAISCLAVLSLPIFVAGCGGDDDEMDINTVLINILFLYS